MCIVCSAATTSRGLLAMLPWLIVPLLLAWPLSHLLLPPDFRLHLTSHRAACLAVLLTSLAWYELIVPRLAAWRHRRAELLRERDRLDAARAARRRREAIKRCRNCHLAYRDQHSATATGKYMCSYCGHASKKPELHVPGEPPQPARLSSSSDSECWRALLEDLDKQRFFRFVLGCVSWLLGLAMWLWKKVGKHERLTECSLRRKLGGRGEVEDAQEKRERARRKTEERRLAKLDRERKEEEERRDREEIKKLVNERSRIRAEEEAAVEREREAERKKQLLQQQQQLQELKEKEVISTTKELAKTKQDSSGVVEAPWEAKSPDLTRRRDRYFSKHHNNNSNSNNKPSSNGQSSPVSSGRSKASVLSSSRSNSSSNNNNNSNSSVDSKISTTPSSSPAAPHVKEAANSRMMSWSSVLSGGYANAIGSPRNSTPAVSPKAPSSKSSPTSEARSTRAAQKLFPEPSSFSSPRPAPVSAEDPIYHPRAAPALPPISAPHNTLNSEPPESSSSPLFTPFFSTPVPVLPAVSSESNNYNHNYNHNHLHRHPVVQLTTSSSLSADAPPFSSSNFPAPAPASCAAFGHSCVQLLPDDLGVSSPASFVEPPLAFRDYFTGGLMSDPVISSDGYSYERHHIQAWLENNDSSPITGMQLPSAPPADTVDRRLWTNYQLQSQINDYHEQRKARERAVSWSAAASFPSPGKHQTGGLYVDPLWSFAGEPGRVSNL